MTSIYMIRDNCIRITQMLVCCTFWWILLLSPLSGGQLQIELAIVYNDIFIFVKLFFWLVDFDSDK